jgi:hypothetical protein
MVGVHQGRPESYAVTLIKQRRRLFLLAISLGQKPRSPLKQKFFAQGEIRPILESSDIYLSES